MELRRKGVYGDQTAPPQKDDDKVECDSVVSAKWSPL